MADWEVWRQDDNGMRSLVATCPDRVEALARVLAFEAGHPHKQPYEIIGEHRAVVRTNRDVYLRIVQLGAALNESGRALLDYLCALWSVSAPMAIRADLDGDHFVAMLAAAATAKPARPDPAWRVADFAVAGTYTGFGCFTKVLCTQIVDLLAFEEDPPGPFAPFGVDAPPRIDGGRATVERWCNFDPATYLECAAAGALGGWDDADGLRVRVADAHGVGGRCEESPLEPLTWGDVAAFLEYGQSFE